MIKSYLINGSKFDIPIRYSPTRLLGVGAYGIVIAARDEQTNEEVAIKKIPDAFKNQVDSKRVLREIKLLRQLKHENIISVLDIFRPPSLLEFRDVYLVSELMATDLHQIISSTQQLSDEHCQYFLYQMLRGLKYLHSANVLHRDLKPSNLLLNSDCLLKIADFGLARVEGDLRVGMTEYITTRWYRAPEVILTWKEYTKAIDVWSVGCIFAETFLRKPLFQGKNYVHQIARITEIIGTPSDDDIANIGTEASRRYILSLPLRPPRSWKDIIPNAPPEAHSMLAGLLSFNPGRRCTVEQALAHPYLSSLHDEDDEPSIDHPFQTDFEDISMTPETCREEVWKEMIHFHPEALEDRTMEDLSGMEVEITHID